MENNQVVISTGQGIQIDYAIDDNYAEIPEIVFELTKLDTLEQFQLNIFQPQDKGNNSLTWLGQTENNKYLSDGTYSFKIYAQDKAGNRSEVIAEYNGINKIKVDRTPPEMVVTAEPVIVTDNQPITTVNYNLKSEISLPVRLIVNLIADDDESYNIIGLMQKDLLNPGLNQYTLDATDLADGSYKLEFMVTDAANNSTEISTTFVKNNIKTKITTPAEGTTVKNQVEIRGVATDPDWFNEIPFAYYKMYYHAGNYQPVTNSEGNLVLSDWNPIPVPVSYQDPEDSLYPSSNTSTKPVTLENTLAYWDFAEEGIPIGEYTILLIATEKGTRNYAYDTKVVNTETDVDLIEPELNINLSTIDLIIDGDSSDSELKINYQLLIKESKIEFNIVRVKEDGTVGEIVWSYNDYSPEIGMEKSISWSGTDFSGAYAQSGNYRFLGSAIALDGNGMDNKEIDFTVKTTLTIQVDNETVSFAPYQSLTDGTAQKLSLNYLLSKKAKVNALIYDLPPSNTEAEVVKTLVEETRNYSHTLNWDGSSDQYQSKIVPLGDYYLKIKAVSGLETEEKIIQVRLVASDLSDRVSAELFIDGEDKDKNEIMETQGYSDFIYEAKGTGELSYFPPREYNVKLTAAGKQKVKEYIDQDVEINYRKWYERIDFKMSPTIKWLGNHGQHRNEAYKTYPFFSKSIYVSIDESKPWNPKLTRPSWTSPEEEANDLFGQGWSNWKYYYAEFKDPPF